MNRLLKIKQTPEQKTYWISDTHFNHNPKWQVPLWEARGFTSSDEHTNGGIDSINAVVRPNDILMHAGDFCLNSDEKQCNELLDRINCQNIYTVWGNHNNPLYRIYQNALKAKFPETVAFAKEQGHGDVEVYPFRYKNVVFLGNYAELTVDGHYFVFCHYPIHVFNYMKDGAKMICGHSHYALEFSKANNLNSKILDVGFDALKRPYSTDEVLSIMNAKTVFNAGDHHVN